MSFYKTYHYSRSEMGRAILAAGQFAHVPERTIWEVLDGLSWPCCQDVTIHTGPLEHFKERGFSAHATLDEFAVRFGTLCPVCLTPVHLEPRSVVWGDYDYMPAWLPYNGDNRYPVSAIEEEPEWYAESWNNRSWPGLGAVGRAHARCGIIDAVSRRIADDDGQKDIETVVHFFRRRTGFKAYLEWLRDRPKFHLRFNPRKHVEPRQRYNDMRWKIDTIRDAA